MFTEYDYANQPIVDIVNDMLIDAAKKERVIFTLIQHQQF